MSPVKSTKFIPSKVKTASNVLSYEPDINKNNKPVFEVTIQYYYYKTPSFKSKNAFCCRTYNTVTVYANVDTPKEAVDYALDNSSIMPNWEVIAREDLVSTDNYRPDSLFFVKVKDVYMKLDKKYWKE